MLRSETTRIRLAAIDIGTNTVKLLIGDSDGNAVDPIYQSSIQTRLGNGLEDTRTLSKASIDETLAAIQSFLQKSRQLDVQQIVANATSAVRDATNGREFVKLVRATSGIEIRVISGEEEADLIFAGIRSGSVSNDENQMIVDVGGGSTELIVARGTSIKLRKSINVGSVRLLESAQLQDPLNSEQRSALSHLLAQRYAPLIEAANAEVPRNQDPTLIAAGGGAVAASMLLNKLTEFHPQNIESHPLSLEQLQHLDTELWTTGLEERRAWPGMPQDRADIIPIGVAIFVHLLQAFKIPQLWVSTRGMRFGLLMKHCQATQEASPKV